ncbi:MAG: hypothetical protein ACYDIA_02190 [Candidatus Humimicrobiaceae bacterium]
MKETSINKINYNHFNRQEHFNNNELSFTEYILPYQYRPFGVNNITIKECASYKEVIIELSGKILKHNYPKLININTINVLETLASSDAISFKPGSFPSGQLLWMDVTDDLKLSEKISSYIGMLYYYRINHRYIVKKYDNDGITFIKDNKTPAYKDRILFYDKQLELLKSRDMITFIAPDKYHTVLRVESNLKTFPQLRRHLKLDSKVITLSQALSSTQPINYNIICDITNGYNADFYIEHQGKKLHQIEKDEGRKSILTKLNRDPRLYRKFIKDHLGGSSNSSKYNREYKEILSEIINKPNKINENKLLNEIKEKLLVK